MRMREYKSGDIETINGWLLKRDMAPIDAEELPPRGWILLEDSKPVGAVFLRLCEGGYGIMDSLINDPEKTPKERNAINDRLFVYVLKMCRKNELKGVYGTTLDKGTLERAKRHGFLPSTQTLCVWRNEQVM